MNNIDTGPNLCVQSQCVYATHHIYKQNEVFAQIVQHLKHVIILYVAVFTLSKSIR